jgi:hypothetical protein
VSKCRSARGCRQMHSIIMSHPFRRRVLLRISYQIPGTLGQRGGRVTGKWTLLAPHYIKGEGNGGRKSGESRIQNPDQTSSIMDTRRAKTVNRDSMQGEMSDVSSTRSTSSPGRARRVSMKIKKGLKEVKEMLSPHHHHHHHHDGGGGEGGEGRQRRRKSGPNESRRGPLAPVLDHLERNNSVPIHLHISHTGSLSVARKASSSSYSCSDFAHDESKTSAEIHQHVQAVEPPQPPQQQSQQEQPQEHSRSEPEVLPEPEPELEPPQPEPPQPAMDVPEPYIVPPSPRRSDDGEETLDPFLVDDPEDPVSDLGSPSPAPAALPLDPGPLLPDTSPSESVTLSPAPTSEPPLLLAEPAPQAPPAVDKPIPALPVVSDTESEQEAPAVHLPQLVMPTMFLPIPNVRINSYLTWWLTRRTPIYY